MTIPDLLKYQAIWENARRFLGEDVNAVLAYLLLLHSSNTLVTFFTPFFDHYDLSEGRFSVLMRLLGEPGQMLSPSQLAQSLGVTRATMTRLLESLERSGLVERRLDVDDRRMWLITLTPSARSHLEEMLPSHFQRIKQVMDVFSEAERDQLIALLLKLEEYLAQE